MLTREQKLLLWLSYGTDGDDTMFFDILAHFVDLEDAFEKAKRDEMEQFGPVPHFVLDRLKQACVEGFLEKYAAWLEKNGIRIMTPYDDLYPVALENEDDPPPVLFSLGTLPEGTTKVYAAIPGEPLLIDQNEPPIVVLAEGIDGVKEALTETVLLDVLKRGAVITPFLPKTLMSEDTIEKAVRIRDILSRQTAEEPDEEDYEQDTQIQPEKTVPFSSLTDDEQRIYMAVRMNEPEVDELCYMTGLSPQAAADAANALLDLGAARIERNRMLLNEQKTRITFEG